MATYNVTGFFSLGMDMKTAQKVFPSLGQYKERKVQRKLHRLNRPSKNNFGKICY